MAVLHGTSSVPRTASLLGCEQAKGLLASSSPILGMVSGTSSASTATLSIRIPQSLHRGSTGQPKLPSFTWIPNGKQIGARVFRISLVHLRKNGVVIRQFVPAITFNPVAVCQRKTPLGIANTQSQQPCPTSVPRFELNQVPAGACATYT